MSCTKCGTSNTACGCKDSPYTTPVPVTCQPDATCPTPSKCSEYMDAACVYLQDGIHDADLPPLTSVEEAIQQLTLMITNPSCTNTDSCNCGGGSSIELQVNGTDNTDQTILNLVDGNNIAITDEGNGEIKITNTYVPINLPVPKVVLKNTIDSKIPYFNRQDNEPSIVSLNLTNAPHVSVMDIPQEVIDAYPIFVEMVIYKRASGSQKKGKKSRHAYVVPVSHVDTGSGFVNTLEQTLGVPLKTRGGNQFLGLNIPINIDRPNHYRVTTENQVLSVYEYLPGWFTNISVSYNDSPSSSALLDCVLPLIINHKNISGGAFGYTRGLKALYIAFRYIAWDSSRNDFITGPLSQTIAVSPLIFPLDLNIPSYVTTGIKWYSVNDSFYKENLKCEFTHRRP